MSLLRGAEPEEAMRMLRKEREIRKEQIEVRRRRGEWPWLGGMLRWGYPPGWIASNGQFSCPRTTS